MPGSRTPLRELGYINMLLAKPHGEKPGVHVETARTWFGDFRSTVDSRILMQLAYGVLSSVWLTILSRFTASHWSLEVWCSRYITSRISQPIREASLCVCLHNYHSLDRHSAAERWRTGDHDCRLLKTDYYAGDEIRDPAVQSHVVRQVCRLLEEKTCTKPRGLSSPETVACLTCESIQLVYEGLF